ncbi:MAG: ATPase, T2SS/T4P/T4SS family, partial [Rhodospirillales bacterium]
MMFGRRQTSEVIPLRKSAPPRTDAPASPDASVRREPQLTAPQPVPVAATPAEPQTRGEPQKSMAGFEATVTRVESLFRERVDMTKAPEMTRGDLARAIDAVVQELAGGGFHALDEHERRDIVTLVLNAFIREFNLPAPSEGGPRRKEPSKKVSQSRGSVEEAKALVQPILMDRLDLAKALELPRNELARQIGEIVVEILGEQKTRLNQLEQRDLVTMLLNDMLGLGPLEALLADDSVTDIMVNGPKQVYVERKGKLEVTDVNFRDNQHVMNIASRIVSRIGRRVDESTPLVDARLEDGSRVNIIIPPLAIDGPSISIRKFSKQKITLDKMVEQQNIGAAMAQVLKIAARA